MSSSGTWWRGDIPGATESLGRLMSGRRINGTAGGALPTVTATTAHQGFRSMAGGASKGRPLLAMAALTWPTPTASDQNGPRWHARGTLALNAAVFFPTPAATDHKTPYRGAALAAQQAKRSKPLRDAISAPAGGKLSPEWVEWLMGWPLGHTGVGRAASAASATGKSRSRRRSRGGCSADQSPTNVTA
jgi:hypothetical protein